MKPFSIEDSLQWAQRFAAREWKLLLPVTFAFLAVPQLAMSLLMPTQIQARLATVDPQTMMSILSDAPWLLPLAIAVQLVALAGGLAIAALALVPRISVREALALAAMRLPIFVAALIVVAFAELAVGVAAAVILGLVRLNLQSAQAALAGFLIGLTMVTAVRLVTLAPVVLASRAGPLASLRLAWDLTAGAFWGVLGGGLAYALGGLVVVFASTFALGAIFILIANAAGAPALGPDLSTIYLRLALAIFWAGFHILMVAFYRQLGGSIRGT